MGDAYIGHQEPLEDARAVVPDGDVYGRVPVLVGHVGAGPGLQQQRHGLRVLGLGGEVERRAEVLVLEVEHVLHAELGQHLRDQPQRRHLLVDHRDVDNAECKCC